jgi:hypothetical protein
MLRLLVTKNISSYNRTIIKAKGKRLLARRRSRCDENIILKIIAGKECEEVKWIEVAKDRPVSGFRTRSADFCNNQTRKCIQFVIYTCIIILKQ